MVQTPTMPSTPSTLKLHTHTRADIEMRALAYLCTLLCVQPLISIHFKCSAQKTQKFNREDFPSDFVFGAGTSAYQVEGAVDEDGRSPSIWDIFTHQGKMPDKSTADVAADGYHKYKEDVKLMSDMGLEGYRFSISWSRLLPNGRGAINLKGLEYYNNLIDELVYNGIQPHVTVHHLDLPQILEDEYAGWLSPKIIDDFTAFADVCFREFGDRVSHWTTINEPNMLAIGGYDQGIWPPQRCSPGIPGVNCNTGNSSVEPYAVMHHALLAHASAAKLYRDKYQEKQKGLIGLNLYAFSCVPMTNSIADAEATKRAMDFYTGWEMDPLVFGDYPEAMKKTVGSRMPSFTANESKLVKGSVDFIGINHYITLYVSDVPPKPTGVVDFNSDMGVQFSGYGSPYSENLNDTARIDYLTGYIGSTLNAIRWCSFSTLLAITYYLSDVEFLLALCNVLRHCRNGTNVRGYLAWSFLDVFEFLSGYKTSYGFIHVDFEDKELRRRPKLSALWFSNFLKGKGKAKKLKSKEIDGNSCSAQNTHKFNREDFPSDFIFGAGTSAYQVEGAVDEDGRSPSIWDTFTHQGNMPDKSTADVAADGYHNDDFTAFADVCFREFGDRVSHWTTINEPNAMAIQGYDQGIWPPQRCSPGIPGVNCNTGNSSVEPYAVMHHALLAHASAAKLYRDKYQEKQKGLIGLNLYAFSCVPMTNSIADAEATKRAMDFFTGWEMDPLVFGDYPEAMKKTVGSRMPSFTANESKLVKGSVDFIGINHYITFYVSDAPPKPTGVVDFNSDMGVQFSGYRSPYDENLNDTARIDYLTGYMGSTLNAIRWYSFSTLLAFTYYLSDEEFLLALCNVLRHCRNGSNVRGYLVWSFLDVFELLSGYKTCYGFIHVDFEDKELRRQPKLSALWFSNFLKGKGKDRKLKGRAIDGSFVGNFHSS
ncbi:hypothetical protein Syun_007912 [Stephania yunnanensis]|uniref:Beta-glucosidase n=1 Tax=Stephania yunnanensis TaxID=152371 RepID=A0AAP0KZG1_9MAGN